ncbi:hypothetical protein HYX10_05505 [Candidatus Woesearchaeota archaeon]|nr:hypothetical protein [Candidatus Woesearchaeota archaeon]
MGLDDLVSDIFNKITRAEDKLINSFWRPGFAADYPKLGATVTGTAVAAGMILSSAGLADYIYLTAIGSAIGAGLGFVSYYINSLIHPVKKQGIDPNRFFELDQQKMASRIPAEYSGLGWLRIRDFLTTHPRSTAAAGTTALASYVYIFNTGSPIDAGAANVLFAGLYLGLRAMLFGGRTILHKSVSDYQKYVTQAELFDLLGHHLRIKRFKDEAIQNAELAEHIMPSFTNKLMLSGLHLDAGHIDEGLLKIKESFEEGTDFLGVDELVSGYKHLLRAGYSLRRIEKGQAVPSDYTNLVNAYKEIGERDRMLLAVQDLSRNIVAVVQQHDAKTDPELARNIISALLLEKVEEMDIAKTHWKVAARKIMHDPTLTQLPFREPGAHRIWRFGPTPYSSDIVIKEEGSDRFEEAATLELAARLTQSRASYYRAPELHTGLVPEDKWGVKWNADYGLVLRYVEGYSLMQLLKNGLLEDRHLTASIEYLAWIQHNMLPELSRKGAVDMGKKLEAAMEKADIQLSEHRKSKIAKNLHFILNAREHSPYVFATDFFPPKLRFGKNPAGEFVVAFDWEDKGQVRLPTDFAKFMIYPDLRYTEQQFSMLRTRADELSAENGFQNPGEFRKLDLDEMILQSIYAMFVWSTGEMQHMREKRQGLIDRYREVHRRIKDENIQHFGYNRTAYENLMGEVQAVEDAISA